MIVVESKKKSTESILKMYLDATVIDVTNQADGGWVKLSPLYPHGGIPVPFSPGTRLRPGSFFRSGRLKLWHKTIDGNEVVVSFLTETIDRNEVMASRLSKTIDGYEVMVS